MSRKNVKRTDSAVEELLAAFESFRQQVLARLAAIDTDELRSRATGLAREADRRSRDARRRAERRLRPKPRRRGAGLTAAVVVFGVGATLYYVLSDAERRRRLTGSIQSLGRGARGQMNGIGVSGAVDGVMSRVRPGSVELAGTALQTEVEGALAAQGGAPAGLEVSVEGRTVYLRGTVADPASLDRSMERIQELPGVVAVVNLTIPAEAGAG